jgi:tetratricopeptide (TPR) repeat protein
LFYACSDQWRVQIEGAQFEGRIGEKEKARQLFQSLCQNVGNGPIYLEASRYEEREGNLIESLQFCDQGLNQNPRYAPLWFQYLRLYEKADAKMQAEKFYDIQTILNDLHANVNPDLEWKIYIEAAQMYERLQQYKKAIGYITNCVMCCPENHKWKVWLLTSRLLMKMGD